MQTTTGRLAIVSGEPHTPHLQALEEIERDSAPGLMETLREEDIFDVRYAL